MAVEFGIVRRFGTPINYGTVSGNPGSPAVSMATGTIINGPSGATGARIEGGDQVSAVLISGAATVINYATIVGFENPGDHHIYFGISLGGAGSISNLGTKSLIENYVGIYASSNATVTNAGTIASNYVGGLDALVFGGGTNRLIIDPGAGGLSVPSAAAASSRWREREHDRHWHHQSAQAPPRWSSSGASAGIAAERPWHEHVGFSAVMIGCDAS